MAESFVWESVFICCSQVSVARKTISCQIAKRNNSIKHISKFSRATVWRMILPVYHIKRLLICVWFDIYIHITESFTNNILPGEWRLVSYKYFSFSQQFASGVKNWEEKKKHTSLVYLTYIIETSRNYSEVYTHEATPSTETMDLMLSLSKSRDLVFQEILVKWKQ